VKRPASAPDFSGLARTIATVFGIGRLPGAPGTWASVAALPVAWVIQSAFGSIGLLTAGVALLVVGGWAADAFERASGRRDPAEVVVDEVAGQWLTLVPVSPDPVIYVLGLALFRLADITKPWPVSWLERRFSGGFGIMIDDVAAAAYAGLCLYVLSQRILMGDAPQ
jgi:phosphatidylglycerophosphatase A